MRRFILTNRMFRDITRDQDFLQIELLQPGVEKKAIEVPAAKDGTVSGLDLARCLRLMADEAEKGS